MRLGPGEAVGREDPDPAAPVDAADPPTAREPAAWAAAVLLGLLLLVGLQRAFALVFVLNFTVAGPGPTLALVALVVSGLLYVAGVPWPHGPRLLHASVALATAGFLLSRTDAGLVAALGAFGFLLLSLPAFLVLVARLRARFAWAAAAAVLLHQAARSGLDSAPLSASAAGQSVAVAAAVAWGVAWILATAREAGSLAGHRGAATDTRDAWMHGRLAPWAPAVAYTYLFVQAFWLGSAAAVARWGPTPTLAVAWFGPLGLVAGAGLALAVRPDRLRAALASGGMLLAAALLVANVLAPLALFGVQIAAAWLLVVGLLGRPAPRGRTGIRAAAGRLAAVQTALVLLALLQASAANWAFMPFPLDALTRGLGPVHLFLLLAVLVGVLRAGALAAVARLASPGRGRPAPRSAPSRMRWSAAAAAVLLVLPAAFVTLHDARPGPGPDPDTVRVMTFNVHQYYPEQGARSSLAAVRDVIAAQRPHVVGLQESEGSRITSSNTDGVRWLGNELGMHHHSAPPGAAQQYGLAVLSVWPIRDAQVQPLPAQESVQRSVLVARLDAPGGPVRVAVTHLQTDAFPDDRMRQTQALVTHLEPLDDLVLLGDFNTEPGQPPHALLARRLTDAWPAAHPDRLDAGHTDPASAPVRRIDQVWVGADWAVLDAQVAGSDSASDHLAVVAQLRRAGSDPAQG